MGNYLITGAGGGMGRALCRLLTEEGHGVWGIDRAPAENPAGWRYIRADVTDAGAVQEAFELVSSEAGTLDGIVHTAGIYDLNSLVEMPEQDFIRDFEVNLVGVFRVNRMFLPLLEKGRIVIVTSELAPLHPLPFTGVYAVTKAALDKYAAALRMELQLLGHSVIVVRPGAVNTQLLDVSTDKLRRFCAETKLYGVNAARFRRIVERVEARAVPPEKIAERIGRILSAGKPKLVYYVNRNPLLLLLNALPARAQLRIVKFILEN
ncbi:MAG: SDR family NAD(P)-dependent oxidoreductase [Oscillospiraceae bacterium]|nr:SDR family NAD(P)-dependent oxidoreductase [Oscillospiraceae bacterium]